MTDVLVQADDLSKKFCRDLKRSLWYGVKDSIYDLMRQDIPDTLRTGEFWANKGVSFEVKRGECLGLIGRNGAGKTTLLKMLNGLIKPDHGSISVKGTVGALIALGAGFNPVLSGRENIYVNGSIMGLSKRQIRDKVDEIVEFAELADSIDAPVRTYSSGMNVRLGFAIAATLIRPDVLLLDEVLAVGDAGFRHRCYSRMNSLMSTSAVILVSHSMEFISQCATVVGLMERGEMTIYNEPSQGVEAYNSNNFDRNKSEIDDNTMRTCDPITHAEARLLTDEIPYGGQLEVELEIECEDTVGEVFISLPVSNSSQQPVMCWNNRRDEKPVRLIPGRQIIQFAIEQVLLHDGLYQCSINLTKKQGLEHIVWHRRFAAFVVKSRHRPVSNIPYLPAASYLRVTPINCEATRA